MAVIKYQLEKKNKYCIFFNFTKLLNEIFEVKFEKHKRDMISHISIIYNFAVLLQRF